MADKVKLPSLHEPALPELLMMVVSKIPHMLENIVRARRALELDKQYGTLAEVELYHVCPEERLLYITLGCYTQPVTSMAAIQRRVLLEFLGLTAGKREPYRLIARQKKRENGDIGIEDFPDDNGESLKPVTPKEALALVPNPTRAELAWATTVHFANLRVAHATDDYLLAGRSVRPHLYNAFRTVPMLMQQVFEERRGLLVGNRPSVQQRP